LIENCAKTYLQLYASPKVYIQGLQPDPHNEREQEVWEGRREKGEWKKEFATPTFQTSSIGTLVLSPSRLSVFIVLFYPSVTNNLSISIKPVTQESSASMLALTKSRRWTLHGILIYRNYFWRIINLIHR
jgi:hypothetical protein